MTDSASERLTVSARDSGGPSKRSLPFQAVVSSIGMLAQGAVRFIYSVVIGWVFGHVALGSVNAGISAGLFVSLLLPYAAGNTVTKYLARGHAAGDVHVAESVAAYVHRLMWVVVLPLSVIIGAITYSSLGLPVSYAIGTSALGIAYSGYIFSRSAILGRRQIERATRWDVVASVIAIAALVPVVVAHEAVWALLALALGYAVYALANPVRVQHGEVSHEVRREVRHFLGVTLLNALTTGGFLQLAMFAARYWDVQGAGSFAAALALATPASLVSRSLQTVLFPTLAAAHGRGDREGARRQADQITRALAWMTALIFGSLVLVSPLLIEIFFSRGNFGEAKVILPILLGAVAVSNVMIGATDSLMSREQRFSLITVGGSAAGFILGVAWWLIWGESGGSRQIAWGYFVGGTVAAAIPIVAAWRIDRHQWGSLWVRFLVAAAFVVGFAVVERHVSEALWMQIALVAAYVLVCAGLSWPEVRKLRRAGTPA